MINKYSVYTVCVCCEIRACCYATVNDGVANVVCLFVVFVVIKGIYAPAAGIHPEQDNKSVLYNTLHYTVSRASYCITLYCIASYHVVLHRIAI